jgi:hypothetical protein
VKRLSKFPNLFTGWMAECRILASPAIQNIVDLTLYEGCMPSSLSLFKSLRSLRWLETQRP